MAISPLPRPEIILGTTDPNDLFYTVNPETLTSNRIFFDAEFMDLGEYCPNISFGFKKKDETLYILSPNFEVLRKRAALQEDRWLTKNVFVEETLYAHEPKRPKTVNEWRGIISDFCGDHPTFWAYTGTYDFFSLCSVFGRFMDKPKTWPNQYNDLKLIMRSLRISSEEYPVLPEELPEHNPLNDALYLERVFNDVCIRAMTGEFGKLGSGIAHLLYMG